MVAIRFSPTVISLHKPDVFRSSGICATRLLRISPGDKLAMGVPKIVISPCSILLSPVRTSTNSLWPLPSTPAMPKISPACTWKEMSVSSDSFRRPLAETPCTFKTTGPVLVLGALIFRKTSLPTINMANFSFVASATSSVPCTFPSRITVIRSDISITSCNLWEMKMTVFPCCFNVSITLNKSSVS